MIFLTISAEWSKNLLLDIKMLKFKFKITISPPFCKFKFDYWLFICKFKFYYLVIHFQEIKIQLTFFMVTFKLEVFSKLSSIRVIKEFEENRKMRPPSFYKRKIVYRFKSKILSLMQMIRKKNSLLLAMLSSSCKDKLFLLTLNINSGDLGKYLLLIFKKYQ
jgi:hypothetical protein